MAVKPNIPLSEDTALVATLAGTALAFSHCAEDEAERWLRALRLHGQVGRALQALGVGEAPLETDGDDICDEPLTTPPLGPSVLERVLREAEDNAAARGALTVATGDLLIALFDVYGAPLDQALQRRGATRDEVLERLGELDEDPEDPTT